MIPMERIHYVEADGTNTNQHTLKRRSALQDQCPPSKKARVEQKNDQESDSFELETSNDDSAEELIQPSRSAPFTPFSSGSSPRFPSNLKTIPCTFPDCGKLFNRPAKLTQHLRSHTNTRPYVCPHPPCVKDFLRESHLKHHIKSQHSSVRDYVCEWEGCGKSFITGTRLRRHRAVHEGENKIRCLVRGCGQVFRKHGTLQKHVKVVHEGQKAFICEIRNGDGENCGAGFDTAGKLKSHEGRVHGGKRFWCLVCSPGAQEKETDTSEQPKEAGFSTYTDLQTHLTNEHPPTCTNCGLQCKSQRDLKIHIDILHSSLGVDERRIHACQEPQCNRGFTKKGNLKAHIQTVHGEKRFICGHIDPAVLNNVGEWDGTNACGRALSTKGNLEEHIRTTHLGLDHSRKNKKHKAERLSRNKTISPLVRLTGAGYKTDSGRDISCLMSNCDFRFSRKHDLEAHLKSYHGLSSYIIENIRNDTGTFVSRPTLDGSLVLATKEDLEAEQALDAQFGYDNQMDDIQVSRQNQPIRSHDLTSDSEIRVSDAKDKWTLKRAQQLYAEDQTFLEHEDQDVEMIDPLLRRENLELCVD